MLFMKHWPFRTSINSYQIIGWELLSYLSVWSVLSREATDTGWMNVPCADAGGDGEMDRGR